MNLDAHYVFILTYTYIQPYTANTPSYSCWIIKIPNHLQLCELPVPAMTPAL